MQSCSMIYLIDVVTLTSQLDYKILKAFIPPQNSITRCRDLSIILAFNEDAIMMMMVGGGDADRITAAKRSCPLG